MAERLTLRALNRATLDRQLLLRRSAMSATEVVEHLGGLQAQTPHSWYAGLWTRLAEFRPEEFAELLVDREVVRIVLMRSTIHLVTARDCLWLRPLVQIVSERGMMGNFGKHLKGLDFDEIAAAGRALVDAEPLTATQLGRGLAEHGREAGWGDRDPASLAQVVRARVPLVQVPPRGVWGSSGPIAHTSAEAWLGASLAAEPSVEDLVLRYLGAFGPATVKDAQVWSGLTKLNEVFDRLRPRLVTFEDEQGRELFDLPDAPRPDPETPAPVRFLYDFDNLLLSHADRTRVITDDYMAQPFNMNIMPCSLLVDGFTNGTWKITRNRKVATLTVKPYRPLTRAETAAVTEEGERLLAFAEAGADTHDLRFLAHDSAEYPWLPAR